MAELEKSLAAEFDEIRSTKKASETEREFDSRLDSDAYRGLRDEMGTRFKGYTRCEYFMRHADNIVSVAILANAVQMGVAIQTKGEPELLWYVCTQIFTVVFGVEMITKLSHQRLLYFKKAWNLLDFFVTNLSIFSYWIMPLFSIEFDLGTLTALRLLRLLRVVRLFRVNRELQSLVEGLLFSLQSLGWILALLFVISYVFAIVITQLIQPSLYVNDPEFPDFDPGLYFGDVVESMLTLFNMCILAEWVEIIRPLWVKQPHIVVFVFIPYLMLCTFGVLNLIIGVIAEQTLAKGAAHKEEELARYLRGKMKMILQMTDEMYEQDNDQVLTKDEFLDVAKRHPDFMEMMRQCDFPRGFDVKNLHLIFDDSGDGRVEKSEFINGMFRLVFNTPAQHASTMLLNLAQVKNDLHSHVDVVLESLSNKLETSLDKVNSDLTTLLGRLGPDGAQIFSPRCEGPGLDANRKSHSLLGKDGDGAPNSLSLPLAGPVSARMRSALQITQDTLGHELKELETRVQQSHAQLNHDLLLALRSSGNTAKPDPDGNDDVQARSTSRDSDGIIQEALGAEFKELQAMVTESQAALKHDLMTAVMSVQQTVAWLVPLAKQAMRDEECATSSRTVWQSFDAESQVKERARGRLIV